MVRQLRHQLTIHRPRGRQASPINIVFRGGGGDLGIDYNGHRQGGDDQRILIGTPSNVILSAKWNVVLLSMLGLLLALIQIKYQNQKDSPFQTQPTIMDIFISALCVYGFAAATTLAKSIASKEVEQQPRNYCRILNILDLGFGILGLISALVSLSCLVFVLTSHGPAGWIVFVSGANIFFALVVAWIFLFPRIFRPINSGQGAAGANMV